MYKLCKPPIHMSVLTLLYQHDLVLVNSLWHSAGSGCWRPASAGSPALAGCGYDSGWAGWRGGG